MFSFIGKVNSAELFKMNGKIIELRKLVAIASDRYGFRLARPHMRGEFTEEDLNSSEPAKTLQKAIKTTNVHLKSLQTLKIS